jgi:hypothetical protein
VDSSGRHTLVPTGGVTISNTVSVFGGASAFFDGSGSLAVSDSADWDFPGDFTVDLWFRTSQASSSRAHLLSFGNGAGQNLDIDLNDPDMGGTGLWVYWGSGGSNAIQSYASVSDDTWHHLAVVRADQVVAVYLDGTSLGSVNDSASVLTSDAGSHIIGAYFMQDRFFYTGYIDELRILKDKAAWTGNFTPPTMAYGP